jgi:hypothetical protein
MEKGFKEKIERKLPLSEEVLKAEAQKIKLECLHLFKTKALCGDLSTNPKGVDYLNKLK